GHTRIGKSDPSTSLLFLKNWYHATPASDYIAITRTAEARILRSRIGIGLHKHFLGAEFGRAIQVDRIHRFIGAERQHAPYALISGGVDYIAAADNVGLDRLERVVFAGRNLLERGGVDDDRHPSESAF